ncbi:MAG: hypothetical protein RIQ52_420 [Pseudomonadota bacterium]|jgi:serine protease Do
MLSRTLRVLAVFSIMLASLPVSAQLPDFTTLVEQNNAVVVNISTTSKTSNSEAQLPEGLELPEGTPYDELFRHFFGEGGGNGNNNAEPPSGESKSLGSGFIISADGFILTNHHVVKGADEIVVRLQDKRELVAKLVGSDKRSDIAVLKVDAAQLPFARIGSSEKLKVGEWVLAIGSPFGFDHSVTAGIVSAKGRSLPSDNYVPFIQTDVAINPGNSGGPLFNLDGEVVGVNSQIYSRTGGFMGLSFAIPMEVALQVVEQLKTSGKVTRGWLGIQIQDVTRELAESFGMKQPQGALVSRILPKSPSQEAGLQVGDIILEYNGQDVASSATLPPLVGATKIGDTSTLKVLRQGNVKMIKIKIGSLPDDDEPAAVTGEAPGAHAIARLGVTAVNPTQEQRQQLELPQHGVLVTATKAGPAQDAGIRKGDVILQVQGQAVKDVDQLGKIIKDVPKGKTVAVLVQRRDSSLFLAVKLSD